MCSDDTLNIGVIVIKGVIDLEKPDGMICTLALQMLKDKEDTNEVWEELQALHKFDSSDVYVDERSGEIICELFGSLVERPYWYLR